MSTAQEIHEKFFPKTRPIARGIDKPRDFLTELKEAEQRGYERGVNEARQGILSDDQKASAIVAVLKDAIVGALRKGRTLTEIAQEVSRDYGFTNWRDLRIRRRNRTLVRARQEAMAISVEETPHSLTEIGQFFGGFDHTTVIHACHAYKKRMSPS